MLRQPGVRQYWTSATLLWVVVLLGVPREGRADHHHHHHPRPAPPVPLPPALPLEPLAVAPPQSDVPQADALPPLPPPSPPPTGPQSQGRLLCGAIETDIDFWTRQPVLKTLAGIEAQEACSELCFNEPRCMAWSLDLKRSSCFLMELEQDEQPTRRPNTDFVSGGLPCGQQSLRPSGTLFCFALMQPEGYEREMLAMQYERRISLFACDNYAIYSNQAIDVVPGVTTHVVDSTLKCDKGGEFMTALNMDIFIKVWEQVVADGIFMDYDWTVKVDADCVFFPDLLRSVLPHHAEEPMGVYLNNCKYGMHGPIEVFSRNAAKSWYGGITTCQAHFTEVCSGYCGWGEDMFIDQCLMKVLNTRRDNEWTLLTEDHCPTNPDEPIEWSALQCISGDIAFHPFKTIESYTECMTIAQRNTIAV